MRNKFSAWLPSLGMALILILTACSTVPLQKPSAPDVTIDSVKLAKFGLKYQELAFNLNVFNPNSYSLPIDSLNFVALYEGENLAEGISDQAVDLPAGGTTPVTINVKTRMNKILMRLLEASANDQATMDITIDGSVKLKNWPARIPFSVDKSFANPGSQDQKLAQ